MYKVVNNNKSIWRYIEALSLHTSAPIVHWEDNTSCISVVEDKIVTPRFKKKSLQSVFYKNNLNIIFFPPNMRSSVSVRKIFALNYVKVQLSAGLLNG